VLNRLGLKDKKEIANLTGLFAEGYNSIFTTKTPTIRVVDDDPDDNKFLECAVALDSKIIISGDKHLKEIKKYIASARPKTPLPWREGLGEGDMEMFFF